MTHTTSETRERILQAATALFLEKGYGAAGMAEILERSNANSGSFYYFFRSKQELLSAVLERYEQILYPVLLQPIWKTTRDPVERIFGLLSKYRELIVASTFSYGCPIGRLALEIDPTQTVIHQKVAFNFSAWKRAVEGCLNEARSQGLLPKAVNAGRLACMVLSVMEGAVMQSRSYRSVQPFDASVEELRRYFAVLKASKAPKRQKARSRRSS